VLYCLKSEFWYARRRQPAHLPLSIVNMASRMGVLPAPDRPIYAAAKAFVLSLTRSVSAQVARWPSQNVPVRVRLNAISPGPVRTPLEVAAFPGRDWASRAAKGVPLGRVAEVDEIVPVVLFLADNRQASYVTGSNYVVDGGFTASPDLG
jgi:NAD(P)-dependent dehydrogenase (short-subunit alcohol dehydrogenase family)